jgi:hypothetical protein
LNFLYQVGKVFVCKGYRFCPYLTFLGLFRQCDIHFVFHFFVSTFLVLWFSVFTLSHLCHITVCIVPLKCTNCIVLLKHAIIFINYNGSHFVNFINIWWLFETSLELLYYYYLRCCNDLVCTDKPQYGSVILWASYWYILYFDSKTFGLQCEGLYLEVFPTARLKLLQRLVFIIHERIGPTTYYYLLKVWSWSLQYQS